MSRIQDFKFSAWKLCNYHKIFLIFFGRVQYTNNLDQAVVAKDHLKIGEGCIS